MHASYMDRPSTSRVYPRGFYARRVLGAQPADPIAVQVTVIVFLAVLALIGLFLTFRK